MQQARADDCLLLLEMDFHSDRGLNQLLQLSAVHLAHFVADAVAPAGKPAIVLVLRQRDPGQDPTVALEPDHALGSGSRDESDVDERGLVAEPVANPRRQRRRECRRIWQVVESLRWPERALHVSVALRCTACR